MRKGSWLFKAALALTVCALTVLAAESYLRLFRPVRFMRPERKYVQAGTGWAHLVHTQSSVPGLSYELAPNVDGEHRDMAIHTNSLGMRDQEPLPADTPRLLRIAAIGDSFTFGYGVDQGQDFPSLLERELNASEPQDGWKFDVLNFGVGGYSTADEVVVLREKALPLKPDLVLVAYCFNDPESKPLHPLQVHFADVAWWQHSELLRWCANVVHGRNVKRYGGDNYYAYLQAPDGPCWPLVAEALDQMRDLTAAKGIPVVFVVLPMLTHQPWSEYRCANLHPFVAKEARARGFHVLDLMDAMKPYEPATLAAAPDDPHFTPLGNQIAARAIEQFLHPLIASARH